MSEKKGTRKAVSTPALSPDELLRLDVVNIAKRAQDGKRLTAGDRSILQALAAGSDAAPKSHVTSWEALAAEIGCTKRSLHTWKKERGAPKVDGGGRHDVAAWRAWVKSTGKKVKGGEDEAEPESKRSVEISILKRKDKLLEIEVNEALGRLISVEEAARISGNGARAIRAKFQALPRSIAPSLVGLPAQQIAKELEAAVKTILDDLHLGEWKES